MKEIDKTSYTLIAIGIVLMFVAIGIGLFVSGIEKHKEQCQETRTTVIYPDDGEPVVTHDYFDCR